MQAAIPDDQITALIPRCQGGEATAVEGLYDLYADRLYRYFLARTGDADVAADLTTELFLRVIKHIGRFRLNLGRPTASFSAWMYRIAANLVADHYRARQRSPETSLEAAALPPCTDDPHGQAEHRESLAQLREAIEELSEEQRLVVLGRFGEGMTNDEVARWLGKTEGAVKALQHRALRTLGRLLKTDTSYD